MIFRVFGWMILSTFAIGTLGWLFLSDWSFKAWGLWELGVFCLAVLINRQAIQLAMGKPKRKSR